MEIICEYGLFIKVECGGVCVCVICQVEVVFEWIVCLYEMCDDEEDMFDSLFIVMDYF